MSVSLTTITGPIYLPNGATPVGGRVSFELSSWDQEEGAGLIVSGPVYSTIDSNGQFSVELYTTASGSNSVHYRMFVIWEDSELSESYVNDIYVGTPTPHYTKKYIGSFALSGPGPFQVSDLNILSETNSSSFDAYLEMRAFTDRIDLGALDDAVASSSANADATASDLIQTGLDRTAAETAANRAEAIGTFDSRSELVTWIASNTPVNGRAYIAGGLTYIGSTGATVIPDMPGVIFGMAPPFATVADLHSSTDGIRGLGSIWEAEGFRYQEAASDATDHHLTTAGGVKLRAIDLSTPTQLRDFDAPGLIDSSLAATRTIFAGGHHRHFGGMARDSRGRLHVVYRRAAGHMMSMPGTIGHTILAANGDVLVAETDIVPATENVDHRDPCIGIMPSGRIVVNWTDAPTSGAGSPHVFLSIYSDDGGATWSSPVTIKTTSGARLYGAPKVIRQNDGQTAILQTGYYGGTPARTVALFRSVNGGQSWSEITPIYAGTDTLLNECEIQPITADHWIAFCRYNTGNLRYFYTADGGATWSAPIWCSWSDNNDVAPSLNIIWQDGQPWIVLSYCNRNTDRTIFRWAQGVKVLSTPYAFAENLWLGSSDMQLSSGYQKGLVLPTGVIQYIEFRENDYTGTTSDPSTTDVRLCHMPASAYINEFVSTWTPTIAGKTTAGTPVYSSRGGRVVRRGSIVHVSGWLALSSKGGMSGQLQIGGLPYTIADLNADRASMYFGFWTGVNMANREHPMGFAVQDTRTVDLYIPAIAGVGSMTDANALDTLNIYFAMTYKAKW